MLTVVSAAIVNMQTRRILLGQRSETSTHALKWCTPGGKVEAGETEFEALRREIREELGIALDFTQGLVYECEVVSVSSGRPVLVKCFRVAMAAIQGDPICGDGIIGIGWFNFQELAAIDLAPADHENRTILMRELIRVRAGHE